MSKIFNQYQEETDVLVAEKTSEGYNLIVHNDEVNTFDWVIKALVEICEHSSIQAEQCSLFIHFQGKYAVKEGELSKLRPLRDAIVERGINATIE
ncbi:MAG: ATP-dependent Clp protease adaptor ClpS [Chitinophagales bacterium]